MKIFDSELNILEVLWEEGDVPAKRVSKVLGERLGWNKNTTYTVIKKCIDKGYVARSEPGFICHALVSQEEARWGAIDSLAERLFGGSVDMLFASLLDSNRLSPERLEKLKDWVAKQE